MTAAQNFDASFSVKPHMLRLSVSATEDIATNTSTVYWSLEIYKHPSGAPFGSNGTWQININGVPYSGTFSYNFNSYSYLLLTTNSISVAHDADGTKAISVAANAYLGSAAGSAFPSGTYTLDTIPRATQPTVSPTSGDTAVTYTITHAPATSSFFHDIAYSLDGGATYTDIIVGLAGTDTSTDWTPAHSLIPNATGVTAVIRVITRATSGGTIIGTKTVNLPLTVPSSVKPIVSSVAWADGQVAAPDVPTLMGGAGRFVQRWSKLKPTVTAAGAGGSTITDTDVTVNGQTTDSGVAFGLPVALSGAVPFSAAATDSRGRVSDPYNSTVTVKAYNFPNLPTPLVTRTSDAAGLIPSPTGTYLAITPAASVSSLDFSGEKNLLEWQIRTRVPGGSWTTKQAWTNATVSGNTWTTKAVYGGYAASSEFEVEVSIRDVFGKNGYDATNTVKTLTIPVASEQVFMDWSGGDYLGIFQYGQFIGLNVGKPIYQEGYPVVDFNDAATTSLPGISELATSAETVTGTDTVRTTTPAGVAAAVAAALVTPNARLSALEAPLKATTRYTAAGIVTTSYVTYVTLTATTKNKPHLLHISASPSNPGSGADRLCSVRVQMDGVTMNEEWANLFIPFLTSNNPVVNFADTYMFTPTAASHTFTLQVTAPVGSSVGLNRASLVLEEA